MPCIIGAPRSFCRILSGLSRPGGARKGGVSAWILPRSWQTTVGWCRSEVACRNWKLALLQAYGSFSDRRIKRLERGHLFIVDDRKVGDHGADRELYPWFCRMFADVISEDEVTVSLHGVPVSREVEEWAQQSGAVVDCGTLVLKLKRGEQALLSALAARVRAIVTPGAHYDVKSYRYVCPRVARSLRPTQARPGWRVAG